MLTRALEAAADALLLLLLFELFASSPITRDLERSMQRKELMKTLTEVKNNEKYIEKMLMEKSLVERNIPTSFC